MSGPALLGNDLSGATLSLGAHSGRWPMAAWNGQRHTSESRNLPRLRQVLTFGYSTEICTDSPVLFHRLK